jgi:hypothetical protein
MFQITLPLVWLTVRIDVVPSARRRVSNPHALRPLSRSASRDLTDALRSRLDPRLLRDIGLDESGSG